MARRAQRLRALSRAKKKAFYARQLGRTLEVIVLREDKETGLLEGLSRNYVTVFFKGDPAWLGKLVSVKIERMVDTTLYGSLMTAEYKK